MEVPDSSWSGRKAGWTAASERASGQSQRAVIACQDLAQRRRLCVCWSRLPAAVTLVSADSNCWGAVGGSGDKIVVFVEAELAIAGRGAGRRG